MEDTESEDEEDQALVTGKRFSCDELDLSDNSDIVSAIEVQPCLMDEVGQVESALFELTREHQLRVQDEVRNQISAMDIAIMNESKKYTAALHHLPLVPFFLSVEALDIHLTAIQRDSELSSQTEERKIQSDAAQTKALQEEK